MLPLEGHEEGSLVRDTLQQRLAVCHMGGVLAHVDGHHSFYGAFLQLPEHSPPEFHLHIRVCNEVPTFKRHSLYFINAQYRRWMGFCHRLCLFRRRYSDLTLDIFLLTRIIEGSYPRHLTLTNIDGEGLTSAVNAVQLIA